MDNLRRGVLAACIGGVSLACSFVANANGSFPDRPIKIINPNPAGAGVDTLVRAFALQLGKELKQTVIVENRPGAGGNIGVDAGAKSAPDGYTITITSNAIFSVVPHVYKALPYSATDDFIPVGILAATGYALVANPNLSVKSVKDVIDASKKAPGSLTFASTGNGTSTHLAAELFQRKAGIQLRHIPYRGGSQALTDLRGGQVDLFFSNIPNVVPLVRQGQIVAFGVSTAKRDAVLKDVPTIAEAGVSGYVCVGWQGISVPKGTPAAIVEKLSQAAIKASKNPEYLASMRGIGFEVVGSTPAEMVKSIQTETEEMKPLIKSLDIKID